MNMIPLSASVISVRTDATPPDSAVDVSLTVEPPPYASISVIAASALGFNRMFVIAATPFAPCPAHAPDVGVAFALETK